MKKTNTFNNENDDLTPEEYDEIVDKVEATIGEGCILSGKDEWRDLWRNLCRVGLYPITDMFDEIMVYEDIYGMRFIALSTRHFGFYPWEQHYVPSRLLGTYYRDARIHQYKILINPHLPEYKGFSLLIDTSSWFLCPVVAEYNHERRSYDLY